VLNRLIRDSRPPAGWEHKILHVEAGLKNSGAVASLCCSAGVSYWRIATLCGNAALRSLSDRSRYGRKANPG
jgi:hypothetical protein